MNGVAYNELTNEELLKLIQNGDRVAYDRIFVKNRRFVFHMANKFKNLPLDYEDIVGLCQVGMVKAVNKYKSDRGVKFVSFASLVIKNEVLAFMKREKKHYKQRKLSLDWSITNEKDGSEIALVDALEADFSEFEKVADREIVSTAIALYLSKSRGVHREVFKYWLSGLNQPEIAEKIGVSQPYISRVLKKINSDLRKIAVKMGVLEKASV